MRVRSSTHRWRARLAAAGLSRGRIRHLAHGSRERLLAFLLWPDHTNAGLMEFGLRRIASAMVNPIMDKLNQKGFARLLVEHLHPDPTTMEAT